LALCDLVTCNPQEEGFEFPADRLRDLTAEAGAAARFYQPDPKGQRRSRQAVAKYHGCDEEHVLLTPGTSVAYWYAFRLLAQPGDEVLCPSPTYPLFDDLARLAHLSVRRYHMHRAGGRWAIDPEEVAFQITPRTRIIVIVSPHNPTGTVASHEELAAMALLAERHGLVVVFDEVFREFVHEPVAVPRPAAVGVGLALVLNGFSKMFSLPGVKAGWMVAEGERQRCDAFMRAAEYLSDTFLPVSEVTQALIPRVFETAGDLPAQFRAEYSRRMKALVATWQSCGVEAMMPQGGVYLPVDLAAAGVKTDEAALIRAVLDAGILAHPGDYYRLPEGYLVMTCVKRPPWPVADLLDLLRS
jgi:aspartate/methionine/tyrosine aminotransferase